MRYTIQINTTGPNPVFAGDLANDATIIGLPEDPELAKLLDQAPEQNTRIHFGHHNWRYVGDVRTDQHTFFQREEDDRLTPRANDWRVEDSTDGKRGEGTITMIQDELINIKDLPDSVLAEWYDLSVSEHAFRNVANDKTELRAQYLHSLTRCAFGSIAMDLYTETERRSNNQTAILVAHTEEQAEAADEEGRELNIARQLERNTARLLKLIHLNAPAVIVQGCVDIIARLAKKYE